MSWIIRIILINHYVFPDSPKRTFCIRFNWQLLTLPSSQTTQKPRTPASPDGDGTSTSFVDNFLSCFFFQNNLASFISKQ